MTYSLNRPHPDHQPSVGRTQIGMTPISPSRPVYGTTLYCSCGHRFGDASYGRNKVSNEAPSRGGRVRANEVYRAHVEAATQAAEA